MSFSNSLKLGTRGSQLALYQAHTVARLLAEAGGPQCEIVIIKTSGDKLQEAPLSEAGGKRLFVKEIEDALLNREIDLAVHSSKDMPAVLPQGLEIAGVLPREDPHDAVVLAHGSGARDQESGARDQGSGSRDPGSGARDQGLGARDEAAGPIVKSIEELTDILGPTPSIGTSSV